MKRKRYRDEQIAFALRQAEAGTPVEEVCRKMGCCRDRLFDTGWDLVETWLDRSDFLAGE